MINNFIESDICILGTGPAGLFANIRLSESGLKVINIGENNFGSLDTFVISDRTINPIPIFPLSEDSFYKKHNKMQFSFLDIKHINTCFDREITITKPYKKGSFVSFLVDKASSQMALVLSEKLFGEIIYEEPMPELQKKVKAHYIRSQKGKRVGYINGKSPYYFILKDNNFREIIQDQIIFLDTKNKIVQTNNTTVQYKVLINTFKLPQFLDLINIDHILEFKSETANLILLSTQENLKENMLIYDCDISSPIYRCFTPDCNTIIVQLSKICSSINIERLINYVKKILTINDDISYIANKTITDSYPISITPYADFINIKQQLISQDIVLLGRYGNWEYKDLHELKWDEVDEVIEIIRRN